MYMQLRGEVHGYKRRLKINSMKEENIIYCFEQFALAKTNKSRMPESTLAFYNLMVELQTAKPLLLLEMLDIKLFEQQYIQFQENIEDQSHPNMAGYL
jgi:hypothetical protein